MKYTRVKPKPKKCEIMFQFIHRKSDLNSIVTYNKMVLSWYVYRFLTVVYMYFRGHSPFFVGTKRTYVRGGNIRDIWFWTPSGSVVNIRSAVVMIKANKHDGDRIHRGRCERSSTWTRSWLCWLGHDLLRCECRLSVILSKSKGIWWMGNYFSLIVLHKFVMLYHCTILND